MVSRVQVTAVVDTPGGAEQLAGLARAMLAKARNLPTGESSGVATGENADGTGQIEATMIFDDPADAQDLFDQLTGPPFRNRLRPAPGISRTYIELHQCGHDETPPAECVVLDTYEVI